MGCASRALAAPLGLALCAVLGGAGPRPDALAAIAGAAGHPAGMHLRAAANRLRDNRTTVETLDVEGTRRLRRRCAADLCTGSWFDGTALHEFGINAAPYPQSANADPALRTYASIASVAFAEPDFRGSVAVLADAGGSERFRVTAPQGEPLVAVADARTHLLVRIERPDGSLVARLIAHRTGGAVLYDEAAYDSVERVSGAIAPPAGPPATVDGTRDVPIVSPTLPIVPCTVDGRRANCLIDTGTTPSAMTLDFAEALGREPRGEIAISALGSYVTGVVDAGRLSIGPAAIGPLHFAVVTQTRGLNFDVILGDDALGALRLVIDSAQRRVTIGPSGALGGPHQVALTFDRGVPFVDALLGTKPFRLMFDSGDSGTFSIPYDAYRRDPALFAPQGSSTAYGLGGIMDAVDGQISQASIGPLVVTRAPIRAVRGQTEGHAGYALAARCGRLTIDLGARRLDCQNI